MNPDDPLGLIGTPKQSADPLGLITPGVPKPGMMGKPIVDASPDVVDPRQERAQAILAHILNTAQGIPGMEAVEAGAGVLGSKLSGQPLSYQESLDALRSQTGKIGGVTSAVEHAIGTAPLLPFLAASPALAGAELGGADQLLNADPNQSLLERGGRTALGAAGGAAVGKAADMLVNAPRALLATSPAENMLDRAAARAASAKRLYGAALAEGQGKVTPPAVRAYLQEPDIAEIVNELQKTREFANVADSSPEMLDAVYKTLSDRAAQVRKGLLAVNPTKPNIGRYQAKDIAAAQQAGLTAIDQVMPTYREAVKDFAQHKAAEDAVGRGYDAMRTGLLKNIPTARNLTRTTPDAFSKWAETAGPDETRAAVEGILGASKKMMTKSPLKATRKVLSFGPSLLRSANDQTALYGPRIGLLAARDAY